MTAKNGMPVPCQAYVLATGFFKRMAGLLDPRVCASGETLVLTHCSSIHTFGMREGIDVAFVDAQMRVLAAWRDVQPNRLLSSHGAACALERRSAFASEWFQAGDMLTIERMAI
jgi:uncharacterized membrane protein (UPF0127 family)